MILTKGSQQSADFQTFDYPCEISPNFYFGRLLLLKLVKNSAKKYGGVMSHDTEE